MNINRAKQMFGSMAAASVNHGREDLQAGRYVALIQGVTNEETRKFVPYMAFNGTVLWPVCDGAGRDISSELYEGSPAGAQANWVVFQNDYFASKIKTILVTCLGMTEEILAEQAKTMTPAQIDEEFFQYCLAMTGEEIQGTETVKTGPGIFDNTTVVELRVTKSDPVPAKEGEEQKPGKIFTNVSVIRKVPLMEVAEKMTEEQITLAFSTFENFTTLLEADE